MGQSDEELARLLQQRKEGLEDVNLRADRVGDFLTVLTQQLDIDLPMRIKSTPAAATFLQSYHTGHSEALQHVRADELLTALFEDLHASRIEMMPVYEEELKWKEAGELDEEDLARTETLGHRLKGMEGSILKIAEMRDNSDNSFEAIKAAAGTAKQIAKDWISKKDTKLSTDDSGINL